MTAEGPRQAAPENETPWKLVLFGVLAVYLLLLVFLNRAQVKVNFVFFSTRISLVVLIVLCIGLGFAGGYLFDQLRSRRRSA